jgi:hypothetical protein
METKSQHQASRVKKVGKFIIGSDKVRGRLAWCGSTESAPRRSIPQRDAEGVNG